MHSRPVSQSQLQASSRVRLDLLDAIYRHWFYSIDVANGKIHRIEAVKGIEAAKIAAFDNCAAIQLRCVPIPCALHAGLVLWLGMAIFTVHFLRPKVPCVGPTP